MARRAFSPGAVGVGREILPGKGFEQGLDGLCDLKDVAGLGQVSLGPGLDALPYVLLEGGGGEEEYGSVPVKGAKPTAELYAGSVRVAVAEQVEVEALFTRQFKATAQAVAELHFIALSLKQQAE